MILPDLILHLKNVVPKDECDDYIHEFERRKVGAEYETSLNSQTKIHEKSNYKVVTLTESYQNYDRLIATMNRGLKNWIEHLETFNAFNTVFYKKKLLYPHKLRILKYQKDCYIHPHTDVDVFEHASITINLNDNYEGGQFCFFNKKHILNLGIGDILVFPADPFWVHEVSPITSGTRYSINSFVCSVPPNIREKFSNTSSTENPVFKYE